LRRLLINREINFDANVRCYSFSVAKLQKRGLAENDIIPLWRRFKLGEALDSDLRKTLIGISKKHNLVVTAGKNHIAKLLANQGGTVPLGYCDVGTSNQAPAAGDTNLIAPIAGAREAADDRFTTNNIATISTLFTSSQKNGTWAEAGIFWDVSGGDMLARALFSPTVSHTGSQADLVDWDCSIN
jgi:hypothetical protein